MAKTKVKISVEKWIWRAFKGKVVKMVGKNEKYLEKAVEEALLDWIYEVKVK